MTAPPSPEEMALDRGIPAGPSAGLYMLGVEDERKRGGGRETELAAELSEVRADWLKDIGEVARERDAVLADLREARAEVERLRAELAQATADPDTYAVLAERKACAAIVRRHAGDIPACDRIADQIEERT